MNVFNDSVQKPDFLQQNLSGLPSQDLPLMCNYVFLAFTQNLLTLLHCKK